MTPDELRIMVHHQPQNQPQQQLAAHSFTNMYRNDGRVGRHDLYRNDGRVGRHDGNHLGDVSQPSVTPWLAPVPLAGAAADANNGRCNLQFGYGAEPKRRNLEVQNFFENNPPISSQNIRRPVSVSTGLGLALNNGQICSPVYDGFLSLIGEELGEELRQQNVEVDRFLNLQADRLRQTVVRKVQEQHLKTLSFVENKFFNKLQEKDSELRAVTQKNMVLEERLEKENMRLDLWQRRSKYNETLTSALRQKLQELYEQNSTDNEGFGDSEVVDTASCRSGRGPDIYFLPKEHSVMRELTTCKGCRQKEVCMLLLPCKHLCLCKECESKVSLCPLCHSSKSLGMKVSVGSDG